MAQFYSAKIELICVDGPKVQIAVSNAPANARKYHDDQHPDLESVDLAPILASITIPTWVAIVAHGSGFKLNLEGLGLSTKIYKKILLEISPTPTGPLDILIQAQGPTQRIEMVAVGEP